ncbi:hypothetical protein CW704_00425 [Candidatus Bathyarchaeota archaeon]|nr:hypothetical protein [Candidatus Bathyarchaeota archaeon]RJS88184.1 MAG: hypothetical protein CW704_00425 [Candidatus Bathyarchaeota archaeon]
MSEKYEFILTYAERIIGILIALIGVSLTYNTYYNQSAAGWGAEYFIAIGVFLTFLGLLMLIVKLK